MVVLAESNTFLTDYWRDMATVVGGGGAVATLLALFFAIWQLLRTKSAAEAARGAAQSARSQVSTNVRIGDLVSANRRVSEIRNYLRGGQDQLAATRLDDLRELLVEISVMRVMTAEEAVKFQNAIAQISSLERAITKPGGPVGANRAHIRLQEVSDLLTRMSTEERFHSQGENDANP